MPHTVDTLPDSRPTPPSTWTRALGQIGPGIVLALASVGASDMVTTLNSGAQYGMALAWVFVVGLVIKYAVNDAVARLQLSDDRSFSSHLTDAGGRTFPVLILIAELLIGIFAVAMTAVGAYWLYGKGYEIDSNDAVFEVGDIIGTNIGSVAHVLFLLAFFAVVYSGVLGGFQGIAYVTGDCVRVIRRYPHQDEPDFDMSAKAPEFRGALLWLTLWSVVILTAGKPVTLVLVYAAISSLMLPVLAIALLILLNRSTTAAELRNGIVSNIMLVACLALSGFLALLQLRETLADLF
ncbi:hypothetical protein AXF14_02610 [Actinomyces radicidentis]|uniref:Manganese transporter n=1 Tax=Actinomyces radicidentis TaxID=111015 RepID=A0A0X8JD62_ACTRD|nr:Nramp family divalent metal transporter [Actinomyces radicidentis]AMD86692.1 hypothetical protein AXF14_02610 [Actinomyces radicidentis]